MSSPVLWGPNNTANNLQSAELLSSGALLAWNGPKNYITYNNFENNVTTGWSLGTVGTQTNGIPTGTPTFGSGASGNLSLSINSSTPIAGIYSLSLASSSATTQGNMLGSQAYTVDTSNQAKVLTFSFYYAVPVGASTANWSGTSSNSFGIAVWDATNSVWLASTANFGMTQSSGVGYATGTCQTGSSTASIQFVIYFVNATTGAITLTLDEFFLGPLTAPVGGPITDWQAAPSGLTTSFVGLGTVTAFTGYTRRVGGNLQGRYFWTNGTVSASTVQIPLSFQGGTSNVTVDTSRIPPSTVIGVGIHAASSGSYFGTYILAPASNQTFLNMSVQLSTGVNATTAQTGSGGWVSNQILAIEFEVPVVGWASQTTMSSDTDTRVVAAATVSATAAITSSYSNVTLVTVNNDTHGGFNASSNATSYTIPVTGYYNIAAQLFLTGTAIAAGNTFNISILNNTTSTTLREAQWASEGVTAVTFSIPIAFDALFLSSGTSLSLQIKSNATGPSIAASSTENFFSIQRVSGPSVIAATESVNMRYFASASAPGTTAAPNAISYTTKDFDSHSAYSGSTYTVPVSGKYLVCASLYQTATTVAASQGYLIQLEKNAAVSSATEVFSSSATTKPISTQLSAMVSCNAGDTLQVFAGNNSTTPATSASNTFNYLAITRIGN